MEEKKDILIGIDDTDNAESRGTGFHSRQIAHLLEVSGLAIVKGITRHQLFVDPRIRYTSQNSAACLNVLSNDLQHIIEVCEAYLNDYSADGSDAGLCVTETIAVDERVTTWGRAAKSTILNIDDATILSKETGIYLNGLTGNHEGIIGALAAVGLRADGNDGRFIWRKGRKELRDMGPCVETAEILFSELELDGISSLSGESPKKDDRIRVSNWVRPILRDNKCILIVEKTKKNEKYEWKITAKEIIRNIS